jgi:hypothetical protein
MKACITEAKMDACFANFGLLENPAQRSSVTGLHLVIIVHKTDYRMFNDFIPIPSVCVTLNLNQLNPNKAVL